MSSYYGPWLNRACLWVSCMGIPVFLIDEIFSFIFQEASRLVRNAYEETKSILNTNRNKLEKVLNFYVCFIGCTLKAEQPLRLLLNLLV